METSVKKIALCFSGQPRTWTKCKDSWLYFVDQLREKTGAEVDIFCHIWNFNTVPHPARVKVDPLLIDSIPVQETELNELIRTLNPVKYIIQDHNTSKLSSERIHFLTQKYNPRSKETLLYWSSSQFYGIMHSAFLKKMYELEHMFNYDVCFRMRYDLFFSEVELEYFFTDFPKIIANNTLYSCHTGSSNFWPFVRLGDIFFYANSITFDKICDFVNWLPDIGTIPFPANDEIMTESALYFYIKMFKIENYAIKVDPKIFRSSDYLDIKTSAGITSGLGSHELI